MDWTRDLRRNQAHKIPFTKIQQRTNEVSYHTEGTLGDYRKLGPIPSGTSLNKVNNPYRSHATDVIHEIDIKKSEAI